MAVSPPPLWLVLHHVDGVGVDVGVVVGYVPPLWSATGFQQQDSSSWTLSTPAAGESHKPPSVIFTYLPWLGRDLNPALVASSRLN
jgi:hypothetical protein